MTSLLHFLETVISGARQAMHDCAPDKDLLYLHDMAAGMQWVSDAGSADFQVHQQVPQQLPKLRQHSLQPRALHLSEESSTVLEAIQRMLRQLVQLLTRSRC